MNPPSQRSLPPLPKLEPSMLLHIPNSSNIFILPTNDYTLYLKTTRNYIASSILSSLSTSPTTILKKFESDKNNLRIVSFNSPSIKGSNNELNPWYEKYVNESHHLDNEEVPPRPPHGIPQDPLDPINEILLLYSDT